LKARHFRNAAQHAGMPRQPSALVVLIFQAGGIALKYRINLAIRQAPEIRRALPRLDPQAKKTERC